MNTIRPVFQITFFLFIYLLIQAGPLFALERITDYDSRVIVDQSGMLTVTETITVVAEGKQIKRGIYRDFPTEYSRAGLRVMVGFKLLGVRKNGRGEPHHTKQQGNGVRLYIGSPNVFLKPGQYTYTIIYQTDRQIGFFSDYDELFWNVTGNGWDFLIEEASVTVVLPERADILQYSLYTGRKGSKDSNAEVVEKLNNKISVRTTVPLASHEGLTIAVGWPKGIVQEPEAEEKVAAIVRDNMTVVAGSVGLCILCIYYIIVWMKVGKDPEKGTLIPRFEPPENFTPAAARYVMRMGYDDKIFAAAIVSMAVKKYLTIEDNDDTFTLKKVGSATNAVLSSGEKKVANKLFSGSDQLKLEKANHGRIGRSVKALEKSLQMDFEKLHFKRNGLYITPGVIITVLIIVSIALTAHDVELAGFMSVWLTFWSLGCAVLVYLSYNAWKTVLSGHSKANEKSGAIVITLFATPFVASWFLGLYALSTATSWLSIYILLVILGVNIVFYRLLRAPTIHGRRIMDQLEGLKLYLSVAEKERLDLLNPPEKTPELFEKFLPWALALGVEHEWSEQFSDVLAGAVEKNSYSPTWYSSYHSFSSAALASSLGSSLASTISSSSTAPGSSSGSGGGGSSGGGGGGGGGGGW